MMAWLVAQLDESWHRQCPGLGSAMAELISMEQWRRACIPPGPPLAGDLIIMMIHDDEPEPPGWTAIPDQPGAYWRIATGSELPYPHPLVVIRPD